MRVFEQIRESIPSVEIVRSTYDFSSIVRFPVVIGGVRVTVNINVPDSDKEYKEEVFYKLNDLVTSIKIIS